MPYNGKQKIYRIQSSKDAIWVYRGAGTHSFCSRFPGFTAGIFLRPAHALELVLSLRMLIVMVIGNCVYASGRSSAGGELEKIISIAQKRAENLQGIPMSNGAITAETIQRAPILQASSITPQKFPIFSWLTTENRIRWLS